MLFLIAGRRSLLSNGAISITFARDRLPHVHRRASLSTFNPFSNAGKEPGVGSNLENPSFLLVAGLAHGVRQRLFSNQAQQLQQQQLALHKLGILQSPSSNMVRPSSRLYPRRARRRPSQRFPFRRPTASAISPPSPTENMLLPVSAVHIAQAIDLYAVASSLFAREASRKQMFSKNSIVVEFPSRPIQKAPGNANGKSSPQSSLASSSSSSSSSSFSPSYVAIFRFGSVVAVNVSPRQLATLVTEIKKHAREPVMSGFERKENFAILLDPSSQQEYHAADQQQQQENGQTYHHHHHHHESSSGLVENIITEDTDSPIIVTGNYCSLPELDMNGVAVISNIMAQTVALDSYNDTVDELLANFGKINSTVTKTGSFSAADKTFLFKTVAQNNSIFIDMISRVRLKDRSETAWNLIKYEKIHYDMKEEFEIDARFDHIEFKLNLIQKNAKFFLEVLQHQNASNLEWIIVVLIAVECVLMCVEMSGMGESIFRPISQIFYS